MNHTLLIIGLPKTGKTTYVAALWYVIETARVLESLKLAELPETREYLNQIRDRWTACEEQKHTPTSVHQEIRLKLWEHPSEEPVELVVPDLSGESFELQWSHRQWSLEYDSLAKAASGAMLFIHPDRVNQPATIPEEESLGALIRDDAAERAANGATALPTVANPAAVDDERDWDPALAPPQVKIVELLQFLTVGPLIRDRFPLAVVISAWDRVRQENVSPDKWLEIHMPLLDQFLKANHEVFAPQIYGISATGGEVPTDADTLLQIANPIERIEVQGSGAAHIRDITAPIRRLMNRTAP